jgi:hypothetical protein
MIKRPGWPTHPNDEFWVHGTSVIYDEGAGEFILCECCSEYAAQGIVDVLRYHQAVATWFCQGPEKPKLRIV